MEHLDLEDMFGRRRKAALKFDYKHLKAEDGTEHLSIRLQNVGRAVAKCTGFLVEFQNVELVDVDGALRNASAINAGPIVQYDNNDGVIHPNGILIYVGAVRFRRVQAHQSVILKMTSYFEGGQPVESQVQF